MGFDGILWDLMGWIPEMVMTHMIDDMENHHAFNGKTHNFNGHVQ